MLLLRTVTRTDGFKFKIRSSTKNDKNNDWPLVVDCSQQRRRSAGGCARKSGWVAFFFLLYSPSVRLPPYKWSGIACPYQRQVIWLQPNRTDRPRRCRRLAWLRSFDNKYQGSCALHWPINMNWRRDISRVNLLRKRKQHAAENKAGVEK